MENKMKWFKHDSNANTDAKLQRVRMKYGMEGYGLYWYLLELIAAGVEKHNITFELEHDSEIIAFNTGIHRDVIQEMMIFFVEQELLENSAGIITCIKMASRTDDYIGRIATKTLRTKSEQTTDKVVVNRIEEKRIEEKRSNRAKRFSPPTLEEIKIYHQERQSTVDCEKFRDFYQSKNWMVGKNKMKDWKAAFRNWERSDKPDKPADDPLLGAIY